MRLTNLCALPAVVVSVACVESIPSQPEGAPAVSGPIVSIESRAPTTRLLIGQATGAPNDSLMIVSTGEGTTIVVRDASGHTRKGTLADLKAGLYVSAWTEGIVKKSMPPVYIAHYLEVGVR